MRFSTIFIAASLFVASQPVFAQQTGSQALGSTGDTGSPLLSLTVTGTASAKPDMAIISGGVQAESLNAADAMRLNNAKMRAIIAAIRKADVDEKDIQTSGISLGQAWEWEDEKRVDKGFRASNSINVRIRKIDDMGDILQAMVDQGATNVNGPNFSLEDDSKLTLAARAQAIEKAAMLASSYAKQTGFSKAMLFSVVEGADYGVEAINSVMYEAADAASPAESVPVQPGEVTKSITISVKYRLVK